MLLSLALVLLGGMFLSGLFKRAHLPGLLGMLVTGIVLGPYALNLLAPSLLVISPDLRQIALIIILTRAGLALDLDDLKKVGRPAILLCFVPACFEIGGMVILAPMLLGLSILDAAIMGAVVAAVSPAVVVPKMLHLMEKGYGTRKAIPQMIMAGASVDDVFVIVLFAAFTGLARGDGITATGFLSIPVSILLGIILGAIIGILVTRLFTSVHMRDSAKVILLLGLAFLLVSAEHALAAVVPFSGLLAVMSMGVAVYRLRPHVAQRLSAKFSKLWVAAEILLFVLVGATVDVGYAVQAGLAAVLLVLAALVFRMAGVFASLLRTPLSMKERLFCMIAYCPKATVQAAIGAIPLSMGLESGQMILTVAVLSILITAPLGAIGIERMYKRCLIREPVADTLQTQSL